MKTETHLGLIVRSEIGAEAYASLVALCPRGDKGTYFKGVFADGDPRLQEVLGCLASHGHRPSVGKQPVQKGEFRLWRERTYDPSDFQEALLVMPWAKACLSDVGVRREGGILELDGGCLDQAPDIGQAGLAAMVVATPLRFRLEEAGMQHVAFAPTTVVGDDAGRYSGHYWELKTDLRLPPLSPACRLIDLDGSPYIAGESRGCIVDDGFEPAELRYEAPRLSATSPFDLARTREPIGEDRGMLVASKRFYDFCQALNLPMDWIPVRIDP